MLYKNLLLRRSSPTFQQNKYRLVQHLAELRIMSQLEQKQRQHHVLFLNEHCRFSSSGNGQKEENEKKIPGKNGTKSTFINAIFTKESQNQVKAITAQAQSIPNIITLSRIASTPILCHFVITEQYQIAITGCFIAGMSDWLDGYIAKTYNQQTVLGTYLDPLADKILINSIALSLSYIDILPLWSSILWLGRDVLLVGMAYRMAAKAAKGRGHNVADPARTPLKVSPTFISKVNTVFQFGTIGVGLCVGYTGDIGSTVHLIGLNCDVGVMEGLSYMTGTTTILSGFSYIDGKAMTKSGNKKKKK